MSLVFGSLSRRGFSGDLSIRSGSKLYRVGWQEGAVVAAESPHPGDSACKLAITLGMITSTQAGEVAQVMAAGGGRDELEVVGQVARLTDDVLGRLARRVVGARAARALDPVEGEFTVSDEVPVGPRIIPIDARWILYTGIRHHFTLERLEREVTALATAIRLREEYDITGFGFGPSEEEVLGRLQDDEMVIAPPPAGLDPQIVHAVALVLIATSECEIVRGGAARAPAVSRLPESVARAGSGPTTPPLTAGTYSSGRLPALPGATENTGPHAPAAASRRAATHPPMVSRAPTPHRLPSLVARASTPLQPPPPMITRAPTPVRNELPPMVNQVATAHNSAGMPPGATPPLGYPAEGAPNRTGQMPRKRTPTTDDATAIRGLIAERLELLGAEADHYALLGIERVADHNAIRAAYFELARLLHPDRLAALGIADEDRSAQRVFARINDAFTVLSTTARRAEYDALIDAGGVKVVAEREAVATATAQAAVEAEERYRLGEMAMRRQQADIAVHEFQRAVELKPDEPDYMSLLGWALYVAARDKVAAVNVARTHLQKALTMKKETALPHLYLGRIARMEGEDDDASRAFRRALQIAPGNSEAQAELRVVEARRKARPPARGGLFSRLGKKP